MRTPGDDTPEPPGGRAAERLRDFLRERAPADQQPEDDASPSDDVSGGRADADDVSQRDEREEKNDDDCRNQPKVKT
jgi:hypothetical protein